jgi:hypothetical protein
MQGNQRGGSLESLHSLGLHRPKNAPLRASWYGSTRSNYRGFHATALPALAFLISNEALLIVWLGSSGPDLILQLQSLTADLYFVLFTSGNHVLDKP